MAIPAKGSRPLTLDGVEYRWRVRTRPTADQRRGESPLLLAIARADGAGPSLLVQLCTAHPSNEVRHRGRAVTPRVVASWIRTGLARGWQPDRPGRPLTLYGHEHAAPPGPRTTPRGPWVVDEAALRTLARRPPSQRNRLRLVDHAPIALPLGGRLQLSVIHVDDVPLVERVAEVERPFVRRELERRRADGEDELEDFSGQYLRESPLPVRLPSRELLDEPWDVAAKGFVLAPDDPLRGKATLLGCTCGITECWFLLARITILDEVVIWSDFEQFHRPWIYDLGPFVFDRAQYMRELAPHREPGSSA